MKIEDNLKIIKLIDTYGSLLTSKQLSVITSYYFDNLSLSEIGDNLSISRQAVSDSLSQSIRSLDGYEDKLHLIEKEDILMTRLESIITECDDSRLVNKLTQIIEDIRG
jgi:predicted DNA-binding protein YlxM (UPF0122 family)